MSETNDQDTGKGRLSLRPAGRLELGRTVDAGSVRQSFSHGRSKVVQVEVRKKRASVGTPGTGTGAPATPAGTAPTARGGAAQEERQVTTAVPRALTATELAARQRALVEQQRESAKREAERREQEREQEKISILSAAEEARRREEEERKAAEEEARRSAEDAARQEAEEAARKAAEAAAATQGTAPAATGEEARSRPAQAPTPTATPTTPTETLRLRPGTRGMEEEEEARPIRRPGGLVMPRKPQTVVAKKGTDAGRRAGRIDVQAAIEGEDERVRSLASVRRQRERERRQAELERLRSDQVKVVRDVILPDNITVQELANRMAARAGEVVKALMKLGVMATITQTLDADTAELVVQEFGHRARRVSEVRCRNGPGRRRRHRGRPETAPAGRYRDGPRRPRQDLAARRAARDRRRRGRGGGHHPAHRRISG